MKAFEAITEFIMSRKFIPVLLLLILGGLFATYAVRGNNDKRPDDPNDKYEKILRNVGIVLEQGHYQPKKIDNAFSQEVLKNYENALDPDKIIFTAQDIAFFKKNYGDRIDDEIHGAPLKSFQAISQTFLKRFDELAALYKKALAEPMNFSKVEYLQTDGAERDYPATPQERFDYARKKMKYQVLIRYVDLQQERDSSKTGEKKTDSELLKEAVSKVSKLMDRYLETTKTHFTIDELFSGFVNSITSTMDPHTTYFAPVDKRTFDEMLSGTFYGIGAQLKDENGQIKIASLIPGMPAWKSGQLHVNDVIIKVGQGNQPPVDVTSYAVTDAVKLIRGSTRGSEVRLTVKKTDGSVKVVSLLRDQIDLTDTYAKSAIIDGKHKIGYIRLPEFYADFQNPKNPRHASADVAKEVEKLKNAGVDGIVIDLRGNGGGSLQDVVEMVGLFVKSGPVVQVKGRDEKAKVLDSPEKDPLYTGPLAVMVDETSASASEIFAAAIQDYHRGIIIGSSTYGKGTVQTNVPLDPQSESMFFSKPSDGLGDLKLTFRKFYRINGGATQLKGVTPDIFLPDPDDKAKVRERDTPDALGWDTISRAKYAVWEPGFSFRNIVAQVSDQVKSNPKFEGIQQIAIEMEKLNNEEVPLQIDEDKKMMVKTRLMAKDLEKYTKPAKPLDVTSLASDLNQIKSDSDQQKTQQLFIKGISNDIYISETVDVVNQLIGEESIVRRQEAAIKP